MGIAPAYFLDEMSFSEVNALLKAKYDSQKERWEQVRQQCFYSVAPYTELKHPKDLFKFPWEVEEKKVSRVSKEKRKRIAGKVEDILNKK